VTVLSLTENAVEDATFADDVSPEVGGIVRASYFQLSSHIAGNNTLRQKN